MQEDNLANLASVGPSAWLYFVEFDDERREVIARLSLCDSDVSVAVMPLLIDLVVDREFSVSVKTPVSSYDGGVLCKISSFYQYAFAFHNASLLSDLVERHGNVTKLCSETRVRFHMQEYEPDANKRDTDVGALCGAVGADPSKVVGYIVFTNAVKELVYAGRMVMCLEEAVQIQIGQSSGTKVPLYPVTLFGGEICNDNDRKDGHADVAAGDADASDSRLTRGGPVSAKCFYCDSLSETLFYFIFTAIGQSLRVDDTRHLIRCGLQQFDDDRALGVRLAPQKRYSGYLSQKLNNAERDQLMLSDAAMAELAFHFVPTFLDSAYECPPTLVFSEWPMVKGASDHVDLLRRIDEFKLHLSTHIAALIFSENSVLYCNRVIFLGGNGKGSGAAGGGGSGTGGGSLSSGSAGSHDMLLRSVQFANGLGCLDEDVYTDQKKLVRVGNGMSARDEGFSMAHLAWACATSPQLVSDLVWYLNRVAMYNTGGEGGNCLINHIVGCGSRSCEACGGNCCHTCYATAYVRTKSRFPNVSRRLRKEPIVVCFFSRFVNDGDVLGSYGKRYVLDQRDSPMSGIGGGGGLLNDGRGSDGLAMGNPGIIGPGGGGGGGVGAGSVDRVKYLNQMMDYCKKNGLIDPISGEDAIAVKNKTEFMNCITALNRFVDDMAVSFVSEVRRKSSKDDLIGATQVFNLDMNPYAVGFSPVLSFQYHKAVSMIVQNIALVSIAVYIADNPLTGASISRWLGQHLQAIGGAFANISARKGFLFMRDVKCSKAVEYERLIDFRAYAETGRYSRVSMETKVSKLSTSSFRTCRIKNRPISRASKSSQGNVFFRRDSVQRRSPIKGCMSFLLYRFHDALFPSCGLSCFDFWQKVCCNALPKSVHLGDLDEFNNFVRFLIGVTSNYNEHDLLDVTPDSILSYVEYRFHNKFLSFFGFKDYISSLHGFTTRLMENHHLNFPYLLDKSPSYASVAEYVLAMKEKKIAGMKAPLVSTVSRESLFRTVFEQRSLVTVAFGIEKYAAVGSNSHDIFQFGQIGYFVGSGVERSLNAMGSFNSQDYRFMRQRCILATKLLDVLIRRTQRDNVIFESDVIKNRVMLALDSSEDPELVAVSEIMNSVSGENGLCPTLDEITFFVDGQESLARSLYDKIVLVIESGADDYSVDGIRRALNVHFSGAGEGDADGVAEARERGSREKYDLSSLFVEDEDSRQGDGGDVVNVAEDCEDDMPLHKRFRL
ncbi:GP57 [Caviid betaherpesvirus 2]|uniref:GP57 n=1 Tax=Guinea pig cytomegalovirus (strain 22122) TaxID=103920 RepID=B7TPX3_GPCMV|nr:GP57 [Caviid betaherpesvirus 2]AGE11536.1 GP57 [Caviid betaherpesvirus 2]AIL83924.1 GP57 [BAC cloning vector GPN13BACdenovo_preserved(MM)]BAJ78525.1 GP57 [Caviid betaherpesvirus 2]